MKFHGAFNPSNPQLNNSHYSALWGYVAPDSREYAILGALDGTYFYDVTDTTNITLVGFIPTDVTFSSWREMKTYSHYAYIVSEASNSGVQIVDLQYLPDSVHFVTKYTPTNHNSTHSISQSGPYLYLNDPDAGSNTGILVLDLTGNPEQPVERGAWDDLYVHDSRIRNDTIWACNIFSGHVTVIDAQNKDNLTTIAQWQNLPDPFPHNCALTNDWKYIFTTDETTTPPGRLKTWDIQDLNNILLVNSWAPPGFENTIVHNIEIYDDLAVIAHYAAGVRVLDISNPLSPQQIAWYDTYPDHNDNEYDGCWGVYMFPSKKIIASDRKYGLYVMSPVLNPVPAIPNADFITSQTEMIRGNDISIFDISSGIPTSWEWTVTGPENFTSNVQNPTFIFDEIGLYTVKLKVNNSLGSDSITKVDYVNVSPVPLNTFGFFVSGIQSIPVSPTDTSRITYDWTNSAIHSSITYKFKMEQFGGSGVRFLNSNNNGHNTSITFTKSYLDSLAVEYGTVGDSVYVRCRAIAYNEVDSLSTGILILNIKRTTVGISPISSEIPGEFKLENNYPNPFNPETNIRYQLPKEGLVSIKLYDITGREVAVLVDEVHSPGFYNFRFDASQYASGVYFYRIQAGGFADIKRMVLIK